MNCNLFKKVIQAPIEALLRLSLQIKYNLIKIQFTHIAILNWIIPSLIKMKKISKLKKSRKYFIKSILSNFKMMILHVSFLKKGKIFLLIENKVLSKRWKPSQEIKISYLKLCKIKITFKT